MQRRIMSLDDAIALQERKIGIIPNKKQEVSLPGDEHEAIVFPGTNNIDAKASLIKKATLGQIPLYDFYYYPEHRGNRPRKVAYDVKPTVEKQDIAADRYKELKEKIRQGYDLTPMEAKEFSIYRTQERQGLKEQGATEVNTLGESVKYGLRSGLAGLLGNIANRPAVIPFINMKPIEWLQKASQAVAPEPYYVKGAKQQIVNELSQGLPINLELMGKQIAYNKGAGLLQRSKYVAENLPKLAAMGEKFPYLVSSVLGGIDESLSEGAGTYGQSMQLEKEAALAEGKKLDKEKAHKSSRSAGLQNFAYNIPLTVGTNLVLDPLYNKGAKYAGGRIAEEEIRKEILAKYGTAVAKDEIDKIVKKALEDNATDAVRRGLISKAAAKLPVKESVQNAIGKAGDFVVRNALNIGGEMVQEGLQEGANNVALANVGLGGYGSLLDNVEHAALMGGLNSVFMGGARSIMNADRAKSGNEQFNKNVKQAVKNGVNEQLVNVMGIQAAEYENVANKGATDSSAMRPTELYDFAKKRQQVLNGMADKGQAIDPNEVKILNDFINVVDQSDKRIAENKKAGPITQTEEDISKAVNNTVQTGATHSKGVQTPPPSVSEAQTTVTQPGQSSTPSQQEVSSQQAPLQNDKETVNYPVPQEKDYSSVSHVTLKRGSQEVKNGYTRRNIIVTDSKGKKTDYTVDVKGDGQYVIRKNGRIVAQDSEAGKRAVNAKAVVIAENITQRLKLPKYSTASQVTTGNADAESVLSLGNNDETKIDENNISGNTNGQNVTPLVNDLQEPQITVQQSDVSKDTKVNSNNARPNMVHTSDSPSRLRADIDQKLKDIDEIINRPVDGNSPNAALQALYREELEEIRNQLLAAKNVQVKKLESEILRKANTDSKKYGDVVAKAQSNADNITRDILDVLSNANTKINVIGSKKMKYTEAQKQAKDSVSGKQEPVIKNSLSQEALHGTKFYSPIEPTPTDLPTGKEESFQPKNNKVLTIDVKNGQWTLNISGKSRNVIARSKKNLPHDKRAILENFYEHGKKIKNKSMEVRVINDIQETPKQSEKEIQEQRQTLLKEQGKYQKNKDGIERYRGNDDYYWQKVYNVASDNTDSRINMSEDVVERDASAISGKEITKKMSVQTNIKDILTPEDIKNALWSEYDRLKNPTSDTDVDYAYLNFLQEQLGVYKQDKAVAVERKKNVSEWFNQKFKESEEPSKIVFANNLIREYNSEKQSILSDINDILKKSLDKGLSTEERRELQRKEIDLRQKLSSKERDIADITKIRDSIQNSYDKKVQQSQQKKNVNNGNERHLTSSELEEIESDPIKLLEHKLDTLSKKIEGYKKYEDVDETGEDFVSASELVRRQNKKITETKQEVERLQKQLTELRQKGKESSSKAEKSNENRNVSASVNSNALNNMISGVFSEFKNANPEATQKHGEKKLFKESDRIQTAGLSQEAYDSLRPATRDFLRDISSDFDPTTHKHFLDLVKEKTVQIKEALYALGQNDTTKSWRTESDKNASKTLYAQLTTKDKSSLEKLFNLLGEHPTTRNAQIEELQKALKCCDDYISKFPQEVRNKKAARHFLNVETVFRKLNRLVYESNKKGVDIIKDLYNTLDTDSPLGALLEKGVSIEDGFAQNTSLSDIREGRAKKEPQTLALNLKYFDGDVSRPNGVEGWTNATEAEINELSDKRGESNKFWQEVSSLDNEELQKVIKQLDRELTRNDIETVSEEDEAELETAAANFDDIRLHKDKVAEERSLRQTIAEQNHLRSFLKAVANNPNIPSAYRDFCQSILEEETDGVDNGEAIVKTWHDLLEKRRDASSDYDIDEKIFYDNLMSAKDAFDKQPGNREIIENKLSGLKTHEFVTNDLKTHIKVTESPVSAGSRIVLTLESNGKTVKVNVVKNDKGQFVYRNNPVPVNGTNVGKVTERILKHKNSVIQYAIFDNFGIKFGGNPKNISLDSFKRRMGQNLQFTKVNVRSGKDHVESLERSKGYLEMQAEQAEKDKTLIDAATRWANKNIIDVQQHKGDPRHFKETIPKNIKEAYVMLSKENVQYATKVASAKSIWNYSKIKESPSEFIARQKAEAKQDKKVSVKNALSSDSKNDFRQTLTVDSVKNMFGEDFGKKMKVTQLPDGSFECELPFNRRFVVTPDAKVGYDYDALVKLYGKEKADEIKANPAKELAGGTILKTVPLIQLADAINNVSERTLKHEIFHLAAATVLLPSELNALYDYYRNQLPEAERENVTNTQLEEMAAIGLGDYANGKKVAPEVEGKFKNIRSFFTSLALRLKSFFSDQAKAKLAEHRRDMIFEDINSGRVFNRNFKEFTITPNGFIKKGTPNAPAYTTKINAFGLRYGTVNPVRVWREHLPDDMFNKVYQAYKTAILDDTNSFEHVFGKDIADKLRQRWTRANVGKAEFHERVGKVLRECGCMADAFRSNADKKKANDRFQAVEAIAFLDRMGALCENEEKGVVTKRDYEIAIAKRKALLDNPDLSADEIKIIKQDINRHMKVIESIDRKRKFGGKKIEHTDEVTSSKFYYDQSEALKKQFPEVLKAVKALQDAGKFVLDELHKCGRISDDDYVNLLRTGKNYIYLGRYAEKGGLFTQATSIDDTLSRIDSIFDIPESPIRSFSDANTESYTLAPITQTALLMNKAMQAVSLQRVHNDIVEHLQDSKNKESLDGLFGELSSSKDKIPAGCSDFYMYYKGEKKHFYILTPLKDFIDAAKITGDTSGIWKIFKAFSNVVYTFATQNPVFGTHNMLGDSWQAAVTTKSFKPLYNTVQHLCSAWIQDDKYWDYIKHGGQDASWATPEGIREWFKSPHDSNGKNIKEGFNKCLSYMSRYVEAGEIATRMGRYELILNEKINEYKKSHSGDTPVGDELEELKFEAGFEADDNLIFDRQGSLIRQINRTVHVPFLSANIGGTYGGLKYLNKKTYKRWVGTAFLCYSLPAIANFLMWHSSPERREQWKNKEGWEKYGYWSIPIPGTQAEARFRIRNLAGFLFYGCMMRTLDTIVDRADGTDDFYKSLLDAMLPNLVPALVTSFYEAKSGRSLFYDRPFESSSDKKLSPENRWDGSTGETFMLLSKFLGATPVRHFDSVYQKTGPKELQGLWRSLTGSGGKMITGVTDPIASVLVNKGVQAEQPWYSKGIGKAFIGDIIGLHDTNEDTGHEQRFRNGLKGYTQALNDYDFAKETTGKKSNNPEAVFAHRNKNLIKRAQEIEKNINKERSHIKKYSRSAEYTSDEKTRKIARAKKNIIELSISGEKCLQTLKNRHSGYFDNTDNQ